MITNQPSIKFFLANYYFDIYKIYCFKMTRPTVADFVDSFFDRILYQPDDTIAFKVLSTELASDANIVVSCFSSFLLHGYTQITWFSKINGDRLTAAEFITFITTKLRTAFLLSITEIKDLNIKTASDSGTTGVVAQWTSYVTKGKTDEKETNHIASLIVKVEEREGKCVITGLWEVAT